MELTQGEINKNRIISGTVAIAVFALLLLFFILFQMITPNPPFPESGGGGGQEFSLGLADVGSSDVDFGSLGSVTQVVTQKDESKAEKEKIVTAENGENVQINEKKPEAKNNTTVITPVKPQEIVKEKSEAEKLAEKFKKNTGKNGGGIGDNAEAGQNGAPDGNPNTEGTGGHGHGIGGGDGDGEGSGSGPGKGPGFGRNIGIDLKGRAVVKPPKLPTDTKEEGKVVVEITVDTEGNVIEANPNGRGTTTSSALLKAKAKQAAMATKFNVDGKFEEQKGTITIIFSFN